MLKNEQVMFKYLLQIRSEVKGLQLASKEVLTLNEAMSYTGYAKSYLYRLVSDRKIPYSKPNGKAIFFERRTLEKWLMSKPFAPINKNQERTRLLLGH